MPFCVASHSWRNVSLAFRKIISPCTHLFITLLFPRREMDGRNIRDKNEYSEPLFWRDYGVTMKTEAAMAPQVVYPSRQQPLCRRGDRVSSYVISNRNEHRRGQRTGWPWIQASYPILLRVRSVQSPAPNQLWEGIGHRGTACAPLRQGRRKSFQEYPWGETLE